MTLVVLWGTGEQIMCAADTRLTSESQETITEHGGKLAVVPVRWAITGADHEERSTSFHSLGFAFCGSTLVASNTHAIASTCAQILHTGQPGAVPSSDLVATIYARAGEHVTRDVNFRLPGKDIFFQGLLFGYCPVRKTLRNHVISPAIENGAFSMKIESFDVRDGVVFAIGSGRSEFLRLSEERSAAGNRQPILDIMQQIMGSGSVRDVGGYPQVAVADKKGVQLQPVLLQNPENPDQALLTINGFDISAVTSSEGFSFGLEALGIGVEPLLEGTLFERKALIRTQARCRERFKTSRPCSLLT